MKRRKKRKNRRRRRCIRDLKTVEQQREQKAHWGIESTEGSGKPFCRLNEQVQQSKEILLKSGQEKKVKMNGRKKEM